MCHQTPLINQGSVSKIYHYTIVSHWQHWLSCQASGEDIMIVDIIMTGEPGEDCGLAGVWLVVCWHVSSLQGCEGAVRVRRFSGQSGLPASPFTTNHHHQPHPPLPITTSLSSPPTPPLPIFYDMHCILHFQLWSFDLRGQETPNLTTNIEIQRYKVLQLSTWAE